jgi:cytochrome c1
MNEGFTRAGFILVALAILANIVILIVSSQTVQAEVPLPAERVVRNGSVASGHTLISEYGCGACHIIPGIPNAKGEVGPSLTGFASRSYIAGRVPNTTDVLIQWLENPQAIDPQTAMPNLGLSSQEARHITAYLYALED